ncbi:hypothetical protein N7461_006629 [Penicillium sp. DV-2018c]|nr:hypothetical protein N7461_006629 [Penicillium sp. DV-2018c]
MLTSPYESIWTTSDQTKRPADADHVPWQWKLTVAWCAALQLVGYMLLAVIIGTPAHELRIDGNASNVCAFAFIGISYGVSAIVAFTKRHQLRFLLHSVFIPYATMNLLALLNVLFHVHGRQLHMNAIRIVGICLPATFSFVYAVASVLIYRENRRQQVEEATMLLSDEELQRRQLLRLLGERNTSAPSPDLIRNTYRFDLPEDDAARKYWNDNS